MVFHVAAGYEEKLQWQYQCQKEQHVAESHPQLVLLENVYIKIVVFYWTLNLCYI